MKAFLFFIILLGSYTLQSQSILNRTLDGSEQGKSLISFLAEIESSAPVRFYFDAAWIQDVTIENSYAGKPLQAMFDDIFGVTDMTFLEFNPHAIVLIKNPNPGLRRKAIVDSLRRRQKDLTKVTFGTAQASNRKSKIKIYGSIVEMQSRKALGGTNVIINDIQTVVTAAENGKYEVVLTPGEHILTFSRVNYDNESIVVEAYQDGKVDMMLNESAIMLQEVLITESATRDITTSKINQTVIRMKDAKRLPALLGEVDLIRQIQSQPGVTTAGEAATGFNVRGGGADQNLTLYDQIPVFNNSHMFGFFSAFSSDNIKEANFIKGGIPAEYGGKASSVLSISSKDGSYDKWSGSGGIGLISSYVTFGGPLKKDTSSLNFSFRTTYSQQWINSIRTNYVDLKNSLAAFYDGSAKYSRRLGKNTRLSVSGYHSQDQFRLTGDSTYQWTNWATSARVDHFFTPDFSMSVVAGWGSYGYKVTDVDPKTGFTLSYQNSYPVLKVDFNYATEKHKFSFGVQSQYYLFSPGTLQPGTGSSTKYVKMDDQYSLESGLYFGDAMSLSDRAMLEVGLRFSVFNSIGPASVTYYKPGVPRSIANIDHVETIPGGKIYNTYTGLEPRVSFRYNLNQEASLKFGYNRMYQYLHLITNTVAITPVDIWQPSNTYFKPEIADQVSFGYFRDLKQKKYEISGEVFYKNIQNILDYKDGAKLILNPNLETNLLSGRGVSYGLETSITKLTGKLTGNLNYTYSRSLRQITGANPEEQINNGNWYSANYDQPHIVNLSWRLALSRRYFFTGNFTYHTGRPVSIPVSASVVDGIPFTNFSERNQYRIPDYHRLDIGFVIEGNHRRKKILDGTWTISIYNVYGRKNPYTVFFRSNADGVFNAYQLSILGSALPSLSYAFKF